MSKKKRIKNEFLQTRPEYKNRIFVINKPVFGRKPNNPQSRSSFLSFRTTCELLMLTEEFCWDKKPSCPL